MSPEVKKAADPKAGGHVALGDDAPKLASLFGISRDRLVVFEVQIALDGKAEFASHRLQFDQADVAELGFAHAEIAEAEARPSDSSSVRRQVHCASGVKSLTTGLKSSADSPLSIAARWAWPNFLHLFASEHS